MVFGSHGCGIWNPRMWNPESTDVESGIQGCGIWNPQTWNPESTAWNPESKTLLGDVIDDKFRHNIVKVAVDPQTTSAML